MRLEFLSILGKPGAGKDTHAKLLLPKLPNATRISTGDICRGARNNRGRYGYYHQDISPHIYDMERGSLVPDETVMGMAKKAVTKAFVFGIDSFILTGFPRTLNQLDLVDSWLDELSITLGKPVDFKVLHLHLENFTANERRENRVKEARANGEPVRRDDREEVFRERLQTYRTQTRPMLAELREEGRLIVVSAEGSIPEVEAEIQHALDFTYSRHPERR